MGLKTRRFLLEIAKSCRAENTLVDAVSARQLWLMRYFKSNG